MAAGRFTPSAGSAVFDDAPRRRNFVRFHTQTCELGVLRATPDPLNAATARGFTGFNQTPPQYHCGHQGSATKTLLSSCSIADGRSIGRSPLPALFSADMRRSRAVAQSVVTTAPEHRNPRSAPFQGEAYSPPGRVVVTTLPHTPQDFDQRPILPLGSKNPAGLQAPSFHILRGRYCTTSNRVTGEYTRMFLCPGWYRAATAPRHLLEKVCRSCGQHATSARSRPRRNAPSRPVLAPRSENATRQTPKKQRQRVALITDPARRRSSPTPGRRPCSA